MLLFVGITLYESYLHVHEKCKRARTMSLYVSQYL